MAASLFSRLAVSPGVSWPLFTPLAMRSCWFSLRCAMLGSAFFSGSCDGVAAAGELCDEDGSCANTVVAPAALTSSASSTAPHFRKVIFMRSLLNGLESVLRVTPGDREIVRGKLVG